MKKTILTILLASCSLGAFAQSVPGYLGKRFSVGYYAYLFPSFRNPNSAEFEFAGNNDRLDLNLSLNYQHHLIGEFVVTKKTSLVADFNYTRTYVDALHGSYFSWTDDYSFDRYPSLDAVGFAFGARRYAEHFAPLGAYTEYRVGYTKLYISDLEYRESGKDFRIPGGATGAFSFAVAIGTQRVIADKWTVDFGADFTFSSKGWLNAKSLVSPDAENPVSFDTTKDPARTANQEALLRQAEGRFFLHSLMNFRVGVGLLP